MVTGTSMASSPSSLRSLASDASRKDAKIGVSANACVIATLSSAVMRVPLTIWSRIAIARRRGDLMSRAVTRAVRTAAPWERRN